MLDYIARKRSKSSARHNICPEQKRNRQNEGIFLIVSIKLQYTCMQVKRKASPGQQKTSWKRPDVYEQLASQTQDLSCLNDSICVHASQVQDKKICSERKRNCQKKNRLRGYFSMFQLNFNTHACKSRARPKIYVQNSKILFGKDRMFINNLQVKCKTCLP